MQTASFLEFDTLSKSSHCFRVLIVQQLMGTEILQLRGQRENKPFLIRYIQIANERRVATRRLKTSQEVLNCKLTKPCGASFYYLSGDIFLKQQEKMPRKKSGLPNRNKCSQYIVWFPLVFLKSLLTSEKSIICVSTQNHQYFDVYFE